MKTLITTLNAKYIHTALSLRLLYVASYKKHDVHFKEYTIKDSLKHIQEDILKQDVDFVAFSCYIWNIEEIKELCTLLKQSKPELLIALGGPEVTYEPEYFIKNYDIDFVMSGEGEEVFPKLLEALENHQDISIPSVSTRNHIDKHVATVDLSYIESLDSPYNLPQDFEDMSKRILYFESSRGCPFQCQYCLSSLEKGLRFFSDDYLKKQLDIICHSQAKTIKFLDRSFNANSEHAIMILDYIFKHHTPGQQFQFEINADVFHQKIIDFIRDHAPKGLLRFEIGIQSTYEPTNRAVKRLQNFERLSGVIKQLMHDGKCDLHLDLIAGLPYESYERFAQSFDDVFVFRAKELQLGFLKMLRGTSLRNQSDEYGYHYDEASPYEMIDNNWLSKEDVKKIHLAEDMLEKYWNSDRFKRTMNKVLDHISSPFEFFYDLGCYYTSQGFKRMGYQLDELYSYLDSYLEKEYHEELIQDYLEQFKVKPKKWYPSTLTIKERKDVIRYLCENYNLNQELLFRYAIIEKLAKGYLVAIYKDYHADIKIYEV